MIVYQLSRSIPPLLLLLAAGIGTASPALADEAKQQTTTATVEPRRLPHSAPAAAEARKLTPAVSGMSGIQAGLGDKSARIAEMDRARGLKELRELAPAAAHLPGRSSLTDLTGTGLGRRNGRFGKADPAGKAPNDNSGFKNPLGNAPALPSNRDKAPNFGLAPSANPRDWMSGSTASGGKTRHRVNHGRTVDIITVTRDSNGNVVVHQRDTYDASDGSYISSSRTDFGSDRSERTTVITRAGETVDASTGERRIIVTEERTTRDAHGTVTGQVNNSGRILGQEKHDPPATDPGNRGGINRTIDPSADTHDANICWEMPWVCRGEPLREPTLVNPGDEPRGFASAPRINPGDSIVVNPSTENVREANQARGIDQDAARRAVSKGTQVNPPGPND